MDKRYEELVNNIQIASPCSVDWDSMTGDEKKRFCGQCKLNVYNSKEMSKAEIVDLFKAANGGRVCMRLYRRKDGTLLTRNCPVAVNRARKAFKRWVAALVGTATTMGLSLPAYAQGAISVDESHAEQGGFSPRPYAQVEANPSMGDVASSYVGKLPEKKETPWYAWGLVAFIFASILVLLKKKSSMWIIGGTMIALFAALGYVWSVGF